MKFCNCFMLVALAIFMSSAAIAQPDTLWTQTYGGTGSDQGESVQQTADGGYIVAGHTASYGAGAKDFYLIKTDDSGDTLWTRTFGGSSADYCYSVQQTDDGGYIVAGRTGSYGAGGSDVYLVKTDVLGDTLWTRTYGGNLDDRGEGVQQTDDGGYIVVGYTASYGMNVYLIKTDALGDTLWTQTYGGSTTDWGYDVQQTSDGGYIIAAYTWSYGAGYNDFYLIKTDALGDTLWTRTFGGTATEVGRSAQQTADGGYIIAGYSNSFGAGVADYDFYLVKTDASGDSLWTRTYGGSGNDRGYRVQQTIDGGYIVVGYTTSFGAGDKDVYLIETDVQGNEEWTATYGGISTDWGYSVQQTTDGGYIIAGYTNSFGAGGYDVYLIRLETEIPDLTVTLTPHDPPIQIPAGGGSFQYDLDIENTTAEAIVADAWIDITPPGAPVIPYIVRLGVTFPASAIVSRTMTQNVPSRAPAGTYLYTCSVGEMMGTVIDFDQFTFEKLAGEGLAVNNWNLSGWPEGAHSGEEEVVQSSAPAEFSFSAYPNPFNPITTISYQLSAISFVNLSVYDISGRKVTELVNGWRDAGVHEVSFDAASLASGVYLYRIETDNFSAVKKMVLMK